MSLCAGTIAETKDFQSFKLRVGFMVVAWQPATTIAQKLRCLKTNPPKSHSSPKPEQKDLVSFSSLMKFGATGLVKSLRPSSRLLYVSTTYYYLLGLVGEWLMT